MVIPYQDRETTVMIVEDSLLLAEDLRNSLIKLGYNVLHIASNGQEAIVKANELKPNLILMDIKLDGHLNGIETSQIIKDNLDIPIIFLTAHSDKQTLDKAKLTEPFGFLLKPFRIDEIHSTINTALHKYRMEIKLRDSEKRFRDLTDLLPQPVFEINNEKLLTFVNRSFLEFFGYTRENFENGLYFTQIFPHDELIQIEEIINSILQGENYPSHEIKTKNKENKIFHELLYANPIEKDGVIIGIRGSIIDITERIVREQELIKQKTYFKSLFESSPDAIVSINNENKILDVNPQFEKLFYYKLEDIRNKNIDLLITPDNRFDEAQKLTDIVGKGSEILYESKRQRSDGSQVDVQIVAAPIVINNKKLGILAMYQDITSRIKSQEQLLEAHEIYQKTIENADGVPYRLDLINKKYTLIGKGFNKLFDFSDNISAYENIKNLKKEISIYSTKTKNYKTYKNKFLNGEIEKYQIDFNFKTKNGDIKWVSDSALPVIDKKTGKILETIGILQDITERKKVEQQAIIERNRAQNYLDVAGVIFLAFNKDYNITLINKKGCEILGYDQNELTNKNWIDKFIPERSQKKLIEYYEKLFTSQLDLFNGNYKSNDSYESKVITKDMKIKTVLWNNIALTDADNKITGILCSGIDITEKKLVEVEKNRLFQQLKRKNEDLERIIYVTSHDLRSPLVNIQGFSSELSNDVKYILDEMDKSINLNELKEKISGIINTDLPESINYIEKSIIKIEALLSGLLQLSRLGRQELNFDKINMNELLKTVMSNFEYQIQLEGIDLKIESLPDCYADGTQINQLFSNLISNAIKFLHKDKKGKIEIRGKKSRKRAIYHVIDNGIGIKNEDQEKIFEVFNRLNSDHSDGDGLGLSIVRRILEKNNGEIKIESEFEKGTKFTVYLPIKPI